MARCLTRKCHVCLTNVGEEKNVSLGCSLRIELEKNLDCQLLVTVTSLAICSPCRSLMELWNVFTAKARNNLAAVCQSATHKSTQDGGGTRLKSNVLTLSVTLTQILQSLNTPQTHNTRVGSNIASTVENGSTESNAVASTSLACHPNIKACRIILDHTEVSNYFQQKTQLHSKPSQDLLSDERPAVQKVTTPGNSQANSHNNLCSLDMKCEFDTELPPSRIIPRAFSPASSTGDNDFKPDISYSPTSPRAGSPISVASSDDEKLQTQVALDITASQEITTPQLQPLLKNTRTRAQRKARNNYNCDVCNESLNSMVALEKHMMLHTKHSKKIPKLKNCAFCNKNFSKRKTLVDHIYTHLRKGNSYCHSCKMIFNSDNELQVHFNSSKCENLLTWECNICYKKYISEKNLGRHSFLVHQIQLNDKTTEESEHINYYPRKYSLPQPKTPVEIARNYKQLYNKDCFKCKFCGLVLTKNETLQLHLLKVHKVDPKKRMSSKHVHNSTNIEDSDDDSQEGKYMNSKFSCNECKLDFPNLFELRLHMLKLHNIVVPKYICNYCDATFQHQGKYEKHIKVDHASRNYMCELCGASFFNKADLGPHFLLHKNKLFTCQICNELFTKAKVLKLHIFLAHIYAKLPHADWKIMEPEEKQVEILLLECEFCTESFTSEHQLEKHNLEHFKNMDTSNGMPTDIDIEMMSSLNKNDDDDVGPIRKSFPCFSCDEDFVLVTHLKEHIQRAHSNATQMQCKLCDKLLPNMKAYVRHTRKEHTLMPGNLLRCPYCGLVSTSKEGLAKHFGGILPPELNIANCCVSSDIERKERKTKKESYNCKFCENVYTSYNGLAKHVNSYHPEEWKHNCKFCGKKFLEFCKAMKHEKSCGKGKFICPYCDLCLSKKEDLKQHVLKKHNGKSAFFCKECDIEFPSPLSLQNHKSKHSELQFTVYKAPKSDEPQSSTESNVPTQEGEDNGTITDTFTCPTCDSPFPTLNKMKIHLITIHQNSTCFCCRICGSAYPFLRSLEKHMFIHSNKKRNKPKMPKKAKPLVKPTTANTKIYECKKCGVQYLACQQYLMHLAKCKPQIPCAGCGVTRVDGGVAKHEVKCKLRQHPYKCTKCPRKFMYKYLLQKHKWSHELCWAEKMKCDHCPLSFDSLFKVLVHYRLHHKHQLPFPLLCKHCDYNCDNKTELILHSRQHNRQMVHCNECHRDVLHSQFKKSHALCCKSFTCSMCGEECKSRTKLFLHVQEDHQIGDHSCLLCLNSFPTETNLQQHITNNHGQVPFQCEICKVNISYKENLRTHLKLHVQSKNRCKICGKQFPHSIDVYNHVLKNHSETIPQNIMAMLNEISNNPLILGKS